MAEAPAFPLWTDAYLADTGHLTTLEHGAYLLLLMAMWRAGGSLPNDDHKLMRFAHLTRGQWARIKPTMMAFFHIEDDQIVQGRLTDELAFVRQHRVKQSNNARAKYRKNNNVDAAVGVPNSSQTPAPTPIPPKSPIRSPYKGRRRMDLSPRTGGKVNRHVDEALFMECLLQSGGNIGTKITEMTFSIEVVAKSIEALERRELADGPVQQN